MGVDACIYFKTRNGDEPTLCDSLPYGCSMVDAKEWAPDGATHEIDQCWRYYGPGYERGPWPSIAAVLMALPAGTERAHGALAGLYGSRQARAPDGAAVPQVRGTQQDAQRPG